MRRTLLALTWLALAVPLSAQTPPQPGERVRVTRAEGRRLVGTVETWTDSTLSLVVDRRGTTHWVDRSSIVGIERSVGTRRNVPKYTAIFAGGGALLGGLGGMGAPLCTPRGGWFDCFMEPTTREEAIRMGVGVGLYVGAFTGLLIGLLKPDQIWADADAPNGEGPRLTVRPSVGSAVGLVGSVRLGGG